VIGNDGVWALEKNPMESLYRCSVTASLRPEARYDNLAEAPGGATASSCASRLSCGPLERAFGSGVPALVNVLADPSVACPRRANLIWHLARAP
jgi:thiamine pyrophosphate-dependent acetolactate synthase large subunit-like protein